MKPFSYITAGNLEKIVLVKLFENTAFQFYKLKMMKLSRTKIHKKSQSLIHYYPILTHIIRHHYCHESLVVGIYGNI